MTYDDLTEQQQDQIFWILHPMYMQVFKGKVFTTEELHTAFKDLPDEIKVVAVDHWIEGLQKLMAYWERKGLQKCG